MNKTIGLDLPSRTQPTKTAFNIRPRNLAIWIDALPRANVGETTKQIYALLLQTNQLAYPYKDRIRFLETLREPVEYVINSMKKYFIGINLPLSDKGHRIATVTKQLYYAMATGYKITLEDAHASNLISFSTKPLAMLTHRSISYTGLNLLICYQSYSPFPDSHWHELHKLYDFAETQKILDSKVTDNQHIFTKETPVATEYARIVLLSLISPYHLRQRESGKIYHALERWLNASIIRPFTSDDKKNDIFIDNLAHARAPSALSLELTKDQFDPAKLRVIEIHKIVEKLKSELKNNEDLVTAQGITAINIPRPELTDDLLQRLIIGWGITNKRHFPRTDKNEQIKMTIGLSAAYQFISLKPLTISPDKTSNKVNQHTQFESTEIKTNSKQPEQSSADVWDLVYPSESTGVKYLTEHDMSLQHDDRIEVNSVDVTVKTEEKKYQTDNWLVVNESDKGLMIKSKDEVKNKSQVGELVSLQRHVSGRAKNWSIGVIRWIKFNQNRSLQMGIETLNPMSSAVGIRANGTDAPLQRTLMLPELKKQPACLITSPMPWREGHKITINMLGKELPATLTKSVQNTGLFAQFQFKINTQNTPVEKVKKLETKPDFSNTWSLI